VQNEQNTGEAAITEAQRPTRANEGVEMDSSEVASPNAAKK
jgi:hypothetical protein